MGRVAAAAWRWSLSHRHAIAAAARRLYGVVCLGGHTLSGRRATVLDPRRAADARDARRLADVREGFLEDRANTKVRHVGASYGARLALDDLRSIGFGRTGCRRHRRASATLSRGDGVEASSTAAATPADAARSEMRRRRAGRRNRALMTPVGFSTVSPPGRTMHHSRSRPTPPSVKRASWLFLSAKMDDMTVIMSILNMKGA